MRSHTPREDSSGTYSRIYAAVARVPRGRVATYGQIARVAGLPGHARMVGYALAALSEGSRVPWHRVINAAGRISLRSDGRPMDEIQRHLLEREGVSFSAGGAVALARFQWRPGGQGGPRAASATRPKRGETTI